MCVSSLVQASLPGMSPLLILSQDRQYVQATKAGAAEAPGAAEQDACRRADSFAPVRASTAGAAGAALPPQTPQEVSGLEAMYGPQQAQQPKQAEAAGGAAGGAAGRPAGAADWGALFDAPSHVLPPLSTLCPAFLELMLSRDGVRGDRDSEQ